MNTPESVKTTRAPVVLKSITYYYHLYKRMVGNKLYFGFVFISCTSAESRHISALEQLFEECC